MLFLYFLLVTIFAHRVYSLHGEFKFYKRWGHEWIQLSILLTDDISDIVS